MSTVDDVDQLIEQYHLALGEFMKGNPEPAQKLFSHRDDATLANPFGGVAHGWKQVAKTMERAAAHYRDGDATGFEPVAKCVTGELAYLVEVERLKAKVDGGEDVAPFALRVTSILRPEEGIWKVVHRHADPITTAQPAESVIQQ
jgi:ketosteroid isomerase-like protein